MSAVCQKIFKQYLLITLKLCEMGIIICSSPVCSHIEGGGVTFQAMQLICRAQGFNYRCGVVQSTESLHHTSLNSNNVKLSEKSYKDKVVVCLFAIVLCSVLSYTGLSQDK